jgi:hypothetical protein
MYLSRSPIISESDIAKVIPIRLAAVKKDRLGRLYPGGKQLMSVHASFVEKPTREAGTHRFDRLHCNVADETLCRGAPKAR